jgi:outer membrane protein assembly factor BamB
MTFNCPFCGAPITGSHPGAAFTCHYCRAKVITPGGSGHHVGDDDDDEGPSRVLDNTPEVAFDPQLGFVAIAGHSPSGEPARIRAWDLKGNRPLWEAQQGQKWVEEISDDEIWVHGRNVYIAKKRQVVVLDLVSGAQKWVASLSDTAVDIADPFPPVGRGAILVATSDHRLFSFDRDSGQPLWNRGFEHGIELEAVAGQCTCLVRVAGTYVKAEIVNPAYPQPISRFGDDHWSTDLGLCRVTGRSVITVAEDMGSEGDDDGLFGFDAVTGQRHFFDRVEDLETGDLAPCAMGPRVFAATDDLDGIYVGPRGRVMPVPIPNHEVVAFCAAGPTLVMLLKKTHGTEIRRIIGIDPHSMAFRFDAGEAGEEPSSDWERQIATDGYSVVYVATDDDENWELRSIDTTSGRRLWTHRLSNQWLDHRFVGGHVVVRTQDGIEVLASANGHAIAVLAS